MRILIAAILLKIRFNATTVAKMV